MDTEVERERVQKDTTAIKEIVAKHQIQARVSKRKIEVYFHKDFGPPARLPLVKAWMAEDGTLFAEEDAQKAVNHVALRRFEAAMSKTQ